MIRFIFILITLVVVALAPIGATMVFSQDDSGDQPVRAEPEPTAPPEPTQQPASNPTPIVVPTMKPNCIPVTAPIPGTTDCGKAAHDAAQKALQESGQAGSQEPPKSSGPGIDLGPLHIDLSNFTDPKWWNAVGLSILQGPIDGVGNLLKGVEEGTINFLTQTPEILRTQEDLQNLRLLGLGIAYIFVVRIMVLVNVHKLLWEVITNQKPDAHLRPTLIHLGIGFFAPLVFYMGTDWVFDYQNQMAAAMNFRPSHSLTVKSNITNAFEMGLSAIPYLLAMLFIFGLFAGRLVGVVFVLLSSAIAGSLIVSWELAPLALLWLEVAALVMFSQSGLLGLMRVDDVIATAAAGEGISFVRTCILLALIVVLWFSPAIYRLCKSYIRKA